MLNTIKSLVAKAWKNQKAALAPGRHYIEEEFLVRISGSVEQRPDEFAAPTVSIPVDPGAGALLGKGRYRPWSCVGDAEAGVA
jgi:hypothetical protein